MCRKRYDSRGSKTCCFCKVEQAIHLSINMDARMQCGKRPWCRIVCLSSARCSCGGGGRTALSPAGRSKQRGGAGQSRAQIGLPPAHECFRAGHQVGGMIVVVASGLRPCMMPCACDRPAVWRIREQSTLRLCPYGIPYIVLKLLLFGVESPDLPDIASAGS